MNVKQDNTGEMGQFKYFPMKGECSKCGSHETMYVGSTLIDEKCCQCGWIIVGGYLPDADECVSDPI